MRHLSRCKSLLGFHIINSNLISIFLQKVKIFRKIFLKYKMCGDGIDSYNILWYHSFVIDSMCVSSPSREGRLGTISLGAKGFALHTLRKSLALLKKQQG